MSASLDLLSEADELQLADFGACATEIIGVADRTRALDPNGSLAAFVLPTRSDEGRTLRPPTWMAGGLVVVLAACGSGPPEEDELACDHYEESVAAAEDDDLTGMLASLNRAADAAGSDLMRTRLEELRASVEGGDLNNDAINSIRVHCGLD